MAGTTVGGKSQLLQATGRHGGHRLVYALGLRSGLQGQSMGGPSSCWRWRNTSGLRRWRGPVPEKRQEPKKDRQRMIADHPMRSNDNCSTPAETWFRPSLEVAW